MQPRPPPALVSPTTNLHPTMATPSNNSQAPGRGTAILVYKKFIHHRVYITTSSVENKWATRKYD